MDNKIRKHVIQDYYNVHHKKMQRLQKLMHGKPTSEWRVLDLGCGYHFPQVTLFNNKVSLICGIDVERFFLRDLLFRNLVVWCKREGPLQGLKRGLSLWTYYSLYYYYLNKLIGHKTDLKKLPLSTYDGHHIPFENEYFDAVISSAVLEHVNDLEAFASECKRVLKVGGIVDMWWHNYYCPSGSHLDKALLRSKPWGHLTGELSHQGRFFLNKKRPDEIKDIFNKYFSVIRVIPSDCKHRLIEENGYEVEGLELLNQESRAKLVDVPIDLLTTTGFVIQAIKKG